MDPIPDVDDTLDVLPDPRDLPPPPLRCAPGTSCAYNYAGMWYKCGATSDETIESEIAAVNVMLRSFVGPARGDANECLVVSQSYNHTKFTTSSGKSVEIYISYCAKPFYVYIEVDGCKTFLESSDAGEIEKLIEEAISGDKKDSN
jgi:hypothetical protein